MTPPTRQSLANDIWRACDILRRDNNCGGVMQYVEHLAWLLFLRFLDAQEEEWAAEAELGSDRYEPILKEAFRWRNWARRDWKSEEARRLRDVAGEEGDKLLDATLVEVFAEQAIEAWEKLPLGRLIEIDAELVDPTLPEYRDMPHIKGAV